MALGTIHSLGPDLFAIEGRPSAPLRIVCRTGARLYLICEDDSPVSVCPEQAAATEALLLSYPKIRELVPLWPSEGALAESPRTRASPEIWTGSTSWVGWIIGDGELLGLRVPSSAKRVILYVADYRLMVLDRHTHVDGEDAELIVRLLAMVDSGMLRLLVVPGHALPLATAAAFQFLVGE